MTSKEKARQLVDKFTAHAYHQDSITQCNDHAKQCALIAVNEIINIGCVEVPYWYEVKTEIELL